MIKNKVDLKEYLKVEKKLYMEIGYKGRIHSFISQCEVGKIYKYIVFLRKNEYYSNLKTRSIIKKMFGLYYKRRHNHLGVQLGMSIPINTFGKGLLVYHSQGIIIHKEARCGEFCKLHGLNCIGNNGFGSGEDNCPQIGDFLDLGIGAKIIGNVKLANNTIIAANAVVCNSIINPGEVWGGIPAVLLKKN